MSRTPSPHTNAGKLNRTSPAAADVGLGSALFDATVAINLAVTAINALRSDYNTLVAKLNADAGVTDTNYAVSSAVAQTAITDLNAR